MRRTIYQDYWVEVLKQVVNDPMQRGRVYAERLAMSHGRVTHVLIGLKKENYIAYYDYKFTNNYGDEPTQRHYYSLKAGNAVIEMIYANELYQRD